MKYKALFVENFNLNTIPMDSNSKIMFKEFNNYGKAYEYGQIFLAKSINNYVKIWSLSTNEVLFESKRNVY